MDKIKSFDAYFSSRPKDEVAEGLLNKFADLKKKAQAKVAQQAPAEEAPAEEETPAAAPAKPKLMGKMGAAKAKIDAAKAAQKPQQQQAKKGLLGKFAGKVAAAKQQQPAANKPSLLKKKGLLKTNESAIIVDSDFKVKTVIEIPKALIDSYCKRVKSETGKVATSIFSREELAEEIVKYLVKNNLNAETIPTAIAVGDTEGESQAAPAPAVDKPQTSTPSDPFADETEEIDIDMDDDDEETPMKKGSSAMDFEGKEVEVGEKDSLELDPKQPKNY